MNKNIATKDDWTINPMPEKHDVFTLNRSFSSEQMERLRYGNIPQEMEDKWFWYMEADKLYAYRSWTGLCIYVIEFRPDNHHLVTVNRDPEQYSCDGVEEELRRLNQLLDWWSQSPYDAYGEWLSETADALRQSRETPYSRTKDKQA